MRGLHLAQAELLARSAHVDDQRLAQRVKALVAGMPTPDSQRLALTRKLRAANEAARRREGRERPR